LERPASKGRDGADCKRIANCRVAAASAFPVGSRRLARPGARVSVPGEGPKPPPARPGGDRLRKSGMEVTYDEELVELAVAPGSSAFRRAGPVHGGRLWRREPHGRAVRRAGAAVKRRSVYERPAPPKVSMIVDQTQGKILGWQRGDEFIPIGSPCCANPLECRKCFGPVAPWWAPWRSAS